MCAMFEIPTSISSSIVLLLLFSSVLNPLFYSVELFGVFDCSRLLHWAFLPSILCTKCSISTTLIHRLIGSIHLLGHRRQNRTTLLSIRERKGALPTYLKSANEVYRYYIKMVYSPLSSHFIRVMFWAKYALIIMMIKETKSYINDSPAPHPIWYHDQREKDNKMTAHHTRVMHTHSNHIYQLLKCLISHLKPIKMANLLFYQ